jgi:carboxymethylenebutenolidase
MCFEATDRPPKPPRTGSLGESERLTLRSDVDVAATFARTTSEDAPGVVILPDIRGLHPYYEALAEAFADAGVHALAIDLYARTAGAEHRGDDFEWQPHRAATRDETVALDVRAAIDELRRRGASRVYVVGFCFGGRAAYMQGSQPGIAGVVGFYGGPTRAGEGGGTSPVEEARAGRLTAPVLAIYGGADENITVEHAEEFAAALDQAGVLQETVVYDGAPHSFFDRKMDEHEQACADAWHRVLRFMGVPVRTPSAA